MLKTISTRLTCCVLALAATTLPATVLFAETGAFDLVGPVLRVTVRHDGASLPLARVPNLSAGDRVSVAVDLPAQQGARYRLVLAFLRGATNPPPKNWLFEAQTWKPKKSTIDAVVPEGAQQALVLLVPDTGGAIGAVASAVRGRPGAFVRASQELNQAMLDRARLTSFLDHLRPGAPAEVAALSTRLGQSLAVKVDPSCVLQQPDARAACLGQGSNAVVLADGQTNSIAQTLAGEPADIALQLASTAQAGYGYYSPYIGVMRDLARILGAFQSAQLQFIPALNLQAGETTDLLLNVVPSFRKPQSVLVVALPPVTDPSPPRLQATGDAPLCLSRPNLTLPVAGAPLVFATEYTRDMAVRLDPIEGKSLEIPVVADPALGGFTIAASAALAPASSPMMSGTLHGTWGFQTFDGPTYRFVTGGKQTWQVADLSTLVVGRDAPIALTGSAVACVADVQVNFADGSARPVSWTADAQDRLALKVPLGDIKPGPVTLLVRSYGEDTPQRIALKAFAEVSRISGFILHAGDAAGVLVGSRLDQIASLDLGGATFKPDALTRVGASDRLVMISDAAANALQPLQKLPVRIVLRDGRELKLNVTVATPRPSAAIVSRSIERAGVATTALDLNRDDVVPFDGRLVFSVRANAATRFTADDRIEVEAGGKTTELPVHLQDPQVAIVVFDPAKALPGSAYGPLRYRIVQQTSAGDWQPLATLVRLPTISGVTCSGTPSICTLRGSDLYLIRSVSAEVEEGKKVMVPDGFTGSALMVPRPADGRLALELRDAPQVFARVRTH
ncbi:hypothetical protein U1701_16345 [Sphingomonas sp. PB2P19]|uniref:hypothetical protein n=1 Tax=Sphingomonas rhamnosi TaxID=3096156 RepID=UPI002FC96AA8